MHPEPQRDPELNLGHGANSPESRGGSFALGAMIHALGSAGLAEVQQRYAQVVPRQYMQAGVQQMTQNTRSALSLGLAPDDPRSGILQGRRYVMTPQNGRSQSTSQAAPFFQDNV